MRRWPTPPAPARARWLRWRRGGSKWRAGAWRVLGGRVPSGDWYSEYDGASFTDGSDLDIDHVVPLAEAWRSGADSWSAQEREDFANDLDVRSSSRSRPRPTGRRGTRTPRRGGPLAPPTSAPTRR
ncbi:GmrSD restriction endonuclease domain-containing protein [Janibacter hoylei]|uniref:GmrSD restriction endonuclease domain-containing protein n=1 Tax=Janibacter hoylei TaxID=364298 RepID=UPI0035CCD71F